eukprot:Awhi_evm1s13792
MEQEHEDGTKAKSCFGDVYYNNSTGRYELIVDVMTPGVLNVLNANQKEQLMACVFRSHDYSLSEEEQRMLFMVLGQVAQNDLCQKIVNLNEKYIQDHENGQSDEDLSRHQSHDDLLTMGEELIGQLNGNRAFG